MDEKLNEAIKYLKLIRKNHDLEKKGYVYTEEAINIVLNRLEEYSKQLDLDYVDKNYIPKKKIEEKLKHKKNKLNQIENDNYRKMCLQVEIDILEDLLNKN